MREIPIFDGILKLHFVNKVLLKFYERSNNLRINDSLDRAINESKSEITKISSQKEKIYVLGNGPSLRESLRVGIKILKQNDLICVNYFSQSDMFENLKPKYYVVLDPHFTDKNSVEKQNCILTVKRINEKTTWELIIFIPDFMKEWSYFKEITNPYVKIIYFKTDCIDFLEDEMIEFKLAMDNRFFLKGCGITVLHAAIYLSLTLGYRKVYIIGADHSWHVDVRVDQNDNSLLSNYSHFYEEKRDWSRQSAFHGFSMTSLFESWVSVFKGHEKLKRYADFCKSEIYNASELSWIDIYERKKLGSE